MEITAFEPHTFIADGDCVVALVHVAATVKETGLSYDEETVHVFDLAESGLVVRVRDHQDTEAVAGALRASPRWD